MEAYLICDLGFGKEMKREAEEILNKNLEGTVEKDKHKKGEVLKIEVSKDEIEKLIHGSKINKRIELIIKNKKEGNTVKSFLKEFTYKINTKKYEDVKDKIEEINKIMKLEEFKLELKKPEMILEFEDGKVKAIFKQKKRRYFVFTQPRSLRPNIVNAILRFGGIKRTGNGTIIDLTSISPFCLESMNINKNLKKISASWSSRITNTMRKNCLAVGEEGVEFKHGILKEIVRETIDDGKYEEKNFYIFAHMPFKNEKIIEEIIEETIRKENKHKKNEIKIEATIILEKEISKKEKEKLKLEEKKAYQGKKEIYIYKKTQN